ncbi:MAG: FKBP-type peptidyl-prolyl cis-trans isomerase [Methanobacteriota archaeon]
MPLRPFLSAFLLLSIMTSGCIRVGGELAAATYTDLHRVGPGDATEFALYVENGDDEPAEFGLRLYGHPAAWRIGFEPERLTLPPGGEGHAVVRVTPDVESPHGLTRVTVGVLGEGRLALFGLYVEVVDPPPEALSPGLGAKVRTVGFYDNGTVFYTNMAGVVENAGLRFHRLGDEPADTDPLKVYVGGRRGTPPPEPYNASGYRPVIQGFDERLRGMRAGETRFVHIAPEKAYTQPGNEDHVLYGEPLNFLVEVVSVDDLGGPDCGLPVCLPPGR